MIHFLGAIQKIIGDSGANLVSCDFEIDECSEQFVNIESAGRKRFLRTNVSPDNFKLYVELSCHVLRINFQFKRVRIVVIYYYSDSRTLVLLNTGSGMPHEILTQANKNWYGQKLSYICFVSTNMVHYENYT